MKVKFPLPEYPQEGQYDDPVQYEMAVMQFGVDCMSVLVQYDKWVNCEQITDIAHASEAAHLQAEADKWQQEVEEAKEYQASEGERCPKKWGHANTAGSCRGVDLRWQEGVEGLCILCKMR